jgi:hypothetical protein
MNCKLWRFQRCGREILFKQPIVMFSTVRSGRHMQNTANCVVSANFIVALRRYLCLCTYPSQILTMCFWNNNNNTFWDLHYSDGSDCGVPACGIACLVGIPYKTARCGLIGCDAVSCRYPPNKITIWILLLQLLPPQIIIIMITAVIRKLKEVYWRDSE